MAWALRFPADSGNSTTNRALVQISGISGTLSTVRYTLHENLPPRPSGIARYLFDIRRLVDSTTPGSGTGWLLTTAVGGIDGSGTSGHLINGIPTTAAGLFGTIAAESICSFNVNSVPSGGCIAFGARFNEVESFTSIAIRNIVIVDGAGTHTIDMSSSGGTSNEFTSTDGAVTLKLFNFTGGQWVFYSSGSTYQLTAQGGTFTYSGQTAALNRGFKLAAQGGTYSYAGASANLSYTTATIYRLDALGASYSYAGASASLLRGFVMDAQGGAYSYAGSDSVLRRGFKLAANGVTYNYAGADASLTYVAGPTVYRLTALGVTYVYSGTDATLTATGVAPAANPNAFHITARVAGPQHISAMIGGALTNNAKIGGNMTISARLSQ